MESVFNLFQEREENKTLVYVSILIVDLCHHSLFIASDFHSLFYRCFCHSSWGSFFPMSIPWILVLPPFRKWPAPPTDLWIFNCIFLLIVRFYNFSMWKYLLNISNALKYSWPLLCWCQAHLPCTSNVLWMSCWFIIIIIFLFNVVELFLKPCEVMLFSGAIAKEKVNYISYLVSFSPSRLNVEECQHCHFGHLCMVNFFGI